MSKSYEYWENRVEEYRDKKSKINKQSDRDNIDKEFFKEVVEYAKEQKKLTPKIGDSILFYQTIFLLNSIGFDDGNV